MAPDEVTKYPDGHYGSLSTEEQELLDKFRSHVTEKGYSGYETATPEVEIKLL